MGLQESFSSAQILTGVVYMMIVTMSLPEGILNIRTVAGKAVAGK